MDERRRARKSTARSPKQAGFKHPQQEARDFSADHARLGLARAGIRHPLAAGEPRQPGNIDRAKGEMLLLPNFRLPTLIHTRSANAKWLYEISHKNPVWMHPKRRRAHGCHDRRPDRIETEIGSMVDSVWVTEGIKPGIIAISHHLGRWRLKQERRHRRRHVEPGRARQERQWEHHNIAAGAAGARPGASPDPDTSRIWWKDVGVHQNLTHAVHPDPISGAHCWHQKALSK